MNMQLLFWAPTIATSLHIIEEFVYPGGFLEWHRRYRPEHSKSITPRFALIINGLLLFLCVAAVINGRSLIGVIEWLAAMAILFTNALFHFRAVISTHMYSPGIITALLVNIPLALYGYYSFLKTGIASPEIAVISFIIGGSYPFLSLILHSVRSRRYTSK